MKLFTLSLIAICSMLFSCVHDGKPSTPAPTPDPTVEPAPPPVSQKFVVHFNFDSFNLVKSQKEDIKKFIENKAKDAPVHIIGHTDSQGKDKYNLSLSKKRAKAVKKYLLKLDMKGPITYEGKGESDLLNADKTVAEHKLNRRAEIIFVLAPVSVQKEVTKKEVKKYKKVKKHKAEPKKAEPTVKEVNIEEVKMVPVPATEPKK